MPFETTATVPGPRPETTVPGLLVGHAQDETALTGATAVLFPPGAVGGYCIRGSAVGARELQPLEPGSLAPQVHGVCLAGGSAFGLDAAGGVVRFLEEQGAGFVVRDRRVPLVPSAILFDLWLGDGTVRPDVAMGYAAATVAAEGPVAEGNVGAGCGATCGKIRGPTYAMKAGLGAAGLETSDGLAVFALCAANPVGDLVDTATGELLAGVRDDSGCLADAASLVRQGTATGPTAPAAPPGAGAASAGGPAAGESTTLAVVATNVGFDKVMATKAAALAADALPRAITPACTLFDGDIVFALSCGMAVGDVHRVGLLMRDCLEVALARAARQARSAGGLPAAGDLPR